MPDKTYRSASDRTQRGSVHLRPRHGAPQAGNPGATDGDGPDPSPCPSDQPKLSAAGKPAVVTGWGNTQSFPQWPDGLRQVTVPLVAREACDVAYQDTGYPPGTITDTMICAGVEEGGKDSCQGDSGGPLVVEDSFLGWWQVGVVSWGEGCALPQIPGVYAHAPAFTDWIDRRVASITLSDYSAGDSVRQPGHLAIGSNVVDTWNHADRVYMPDLQRNEPVAR
ncbi:MAG: serine protease [Anaerolineales bacterium]|nr:serine protease [Anaerolineales bacterium]